MKALTLSSLVLCAQVAAVAPAFAQDFDSLVSQAMTHYQANEFLQAIEDFEAAYLIKQQPELIYNIARSYEKALRQEQALEAYERFVKLPGTTAQLRTKALSAIAALKAERAARTEANRPAVAPSNPQVLNDRSVRPSGTVSGNVGEEPSRTLEWTLVAGGAAVAAAGGVFAGLAFSSNSDFDAEKTKTPSDQNRLKDLQDQTNRNALIADIMIGTGALAAAVGVVMFLMADDEPSDQVAVAPWIGGEGQGGVALSGSF